MNTNLCRCFVMTVIFGFLSSPCTYAFSDNGKQLLESLRMKVNSQAASPTIALASEDVEISGSKLFAQPSNVTPTFEAKETKTSIYLPSDFESKTKQMPAAKQIEANEPENSQKNLKNPPQTKNMKTTSSDASTKLKLESALKELETLKQRLKAKESSAGAESAVEEEKKKAATKLLSADQTQQTQAAVADNEGKKSLSVEPARSFGELSDAELIEYAQKHVWSAERTKKHNPPPTPPTKKVAKKNSTSISNSKSAVKNSNKTAKANTTLNKDKKTASQKTAAPSKKADNVANSTADKKSESETTSK